MVGVEPPKVEKYVKSLNEDTLFEMIDSGKTLFVQFIHPSNRFCTLFAPVYNKIARAYLNEPKVTLFI